MSELFQRFTFGDQRFQRGSRIIEIEKVFATPNQILGGPCLIQLMHMLHSTSPQRFLKHKQLYRVRIDDHIKKDLNQRH